MFIVLSVFLLWILLGIFTLCVCLLIDKKQWVSKWWANSEGETKVIATGSDVLYTIAMGVIPMFIYVLPNVVMYCIVEKHNEVKVKQACTETPDDNPNDDTPNERIRGNN